MSIPASVEQVDLPQARYSRKPQQRASKRDAGLYDLDAAIKTGEIGGHVLDFGKDGGAGLEKRKGRWSWTWAGEERTGPSQFALGKFDLC
jgi:hypothetical protein